MGYVPSAIEKLEIPSCYGKCIPLCQPLQATKVCFRKLAPGSPRNPGIQAKAIPSLSHSLSSAPALHALDRLVMGTLNMATVLERTLREKVAITENGKRKIITKLEAAIKQLTNKAASGDLKALQLLAALARSAEERATQTAAPSAALDEVEEKVVLGILERLEATSKREQGEADEANTQ